MNDPDVKEANIYSKHQSVVTVQCIFINNNKHFEKHFAK